MLSVFSFELSKELVILCSLLIKSMWLITIKLCVVQKKEKEQKKKEQDELREIFKPITQKVSAGRTNANLKP